MQNDRLLAPGALLFVVLAHIGAFILSLYLHVNMPKLDISSDSLSYVDLSGLSAAGAGGGPAPEAPPAATANPVPAQPPRPQAKPRETPAPKPALKPVIRPDAPRSDAVPVPKQETRPDPKPEPKPETRAETRQPVREAAPIQQETPRSETAAGSQNARTAPGGEGGGGAQSGSGRGAAQQGSGSGSGGSSQDGGNSGGTLVPATHLGGHLNNPRPPYPPMSLELGEEGVVGLRVAVTADGRAQSVTVVKRSGYPRLDRAAKTAVEKYRFRPATRGGTPIPYNYTFSVTFSLPN